MYKVPAITMIKYLEDNWKSKKCPMCNQDNWTISANVFELREFRDGSLNAKSPLYPVIPITCNNCGNTIFINALKAGALSNITHGGN